MSPSNQEMAQTHEFDSLYGSPESWGLEVVGEVDSGGDYEFDKTCVWRHKSSGALFWAHDSGCSCPLPFENYSSLMELDTLTSKEDFKAFEMFLEKNHRLHNNLGILLNRVQRLMEDNKTSALQDLPT